MADGEQIYNERKSEELVYSRSADYSTRSLHTATTLDRYLYLSIQLIRQDQKGKRVRERRGEEEEDDEAHFLSHSTLALCD